MTYLCDFGILVFIISISISIAYRPCRLLHTIMLFLLLLVDEKTDAHQDASFWAPLSSIGLVRVLSGRSSIDKILRNTIDQSLRNTIDKSLRNTIDKSLRNSSAKAQKSDSQRGINPRLDILMKDACHFTPLLDYCNIIMKFSEYQWQYI